MTLNETEFTFESLSHTLQIESDSFLPTELHGYITGLVCGYQQQVNSDKKLFDLVLDKLGEESLSPQTYKELFAHWLVKLFQQLQDFNYSFDLVLPADTNSLNHRLKALGKWCQHFLSGLGQANFKPTSSDADLSSALNQLFAISHVQSNQETNEQNENHYMELCEHVRISVLFIYTENIMKPTVNS
jgi:uncharacterized protein